MPTRTELREIEKIVDKCLPDKDTAARLKQALRSDLQHRPPPDIAADDDLDELWDNLPV